MFDKILKNLTSQGDAAGAEGGIVSKNIIESDASSFNRKSKVNPKLTSSERQRTINQTTVFWETYYKIRGKFEKDTKATTKTTPVKSAAAASKAGGEKEAAKQGKGIFGTIMAIAGFLMTFGKPLIKLLGKLLLRGLKALGKLLLKGLKALGKLLKPLFKGLLKIARKVLRFAWKTLKKSAKAIFRFVKRLVTRAIKGIGRVLKKAFTGLMKSKPVQAAKKLIQEGVEKAKNFFTRIKDFFLKKIKAVGKFFKNIISKIPGLGKLFPALAKGATGGAAGAVAGATASPRPGGGGKPPKPKPSMFGRIGSFLGKGASAVSSGAKFVANKTVSAGKYVAKKTGQGIKAVKNIGAKAAKGAVAKFAGKLVGSSGKSLVKFLGGAAKRIPIIGPAIQAIFTGFEIKKLKEQYAKGELTEDELHQKIGATSINGIGKAVGAGSGALLGGMIGLAGGPVAIISAIVGGVLGDMLGGVVANLLTKYVIPEKFTKDIGKFFAGDQPAPGEMQDFIMQGGKVKPFSNKDQILGFKTDGAMDKLLDSVKGAGTGISGMMGKIDTSKLTSGIQGAAGGMGAMFSKIGSGLSSLAGGGGLKEEIHKSNYYLKQLVELTAQGNSIKGGRSRVSSGGGSGTSPAIPTGGKSDSRSDYFNSPYSINVPGVG